MAKTKTAKTGTKAKHPRKPSPFTVLGIPRAATAAEIVAAFRAKAKQFHPDTSDHPDAAAKFREVRAAYEKLETPAIAAMASLAETNAATFADELVEHGIGWPAEFEECPLLRPLIEFSIARAFAKHARSDRAKSWAFADRALELVNASVGHTDTVPTGLWTGRPALREQVRGAIIEAHRRWAELVALAEGEAGEEAAA